MASSDNPPTDSNRQTNASEQSSVMDLSRSLSLPLVTPRMLIMTQLLSRREPAHPFSQVPPHTMPSGLIPELLDVPLPSNPETVELVRNIALALGDPAIYSSLRIFHCQVCNKAKFKAAASSPYPTHHPWALSINELPLRQLAHHPARQLAQCARSQFVCSDCFLGAITAALDGDFFSNIPHGHNSRWIRCPVPECNEFLDMPPGELGNTLLRLGGEDTAAMLTTKYTRVTTMREALMDIHRDPKNPVVFTPQGLAEAAALHAHLQRYGIMKSFFDPCFDTVSDEEGNVRLFTAGLIKISSLHRPHGDLTIPIFMKFFNRKSPANGLECRWCLGLKCEIDCDIDRWLQILSPPESPKRFWGPWMWKVMVFTHYLSFRTRDPQDVRKACTHPVNYCRGCMEEYLEFQVDYLGLGAPGKVPCPDCARKLSDDEISLYVDEKTLNKYKILARRAAMASNPGYRECSMCDDAGIYEVNGDGKDRMIECVKCAYKMCFWHKAPWHEGLTCDEFDQKMENDGSFQDSKQWLKEQTKNCPGDGCGAPIEKLDGCDHMRCGNCSLDFCWLCLAEWRSEDHEVHNEGCPYREHGMDGDGPRHVPQAPEAMRSPVNDEE